MKFSIVTASHRQLAWLKRCARSVADQRGGFEIEHIVQDAGTGPELESWARAQPGMRLFVEKDTGMYDALNRGFRRAEGDVLGILNCDEQYLPGTLARVAEAFEKEPNADILAGDFLLVDATGKLLAFRKATPLRAAMILTDHLYDFTCAMFFRRSFWLKSGVEFDPGYRAAGDADFVARLLRAGARARCIPAYLATFVVTEENLSLRADPAGEAARLRRITPGWARAAAPALRQLRHVEKLLAGGYRPAPISYEIYAGEEDAQRTRFACERPSFRHPWSRGPL